MMTLIIEFTNLTTNKPEVAKITASNGYMMNAKLAELDNRNTFIDAFELMTEDGTSGGRGNNAGAELYAILEA